MIRSCNAVERTTLAVHFPENNHTSQNARQPIRFKHSTARGISSDNGVRVILEFKIACALCSLQQQLKPFQAQNTLIKTGFKGPNLNFHQRQRSKPEQWVITKLVFNKHT